MEQSSIPAGQDFCEGLYLIKMKAHLTPEGLKKLHDLAKGMNTGRKF